MPWTVSWMEDDERADKRVIVLEPHDPWTWEDLQQATQRAQEMTTQQPDTVDLIFQLGGELRLPDTPDDGTRVAPWMPLREMLLNRPPNRGLIVLESAPLYVESIVGVLKSVLKNQVSTEDIVFVSTMREAQEVIQNRRATQRK